jgi:hypothetical protein
MPAGSHAVLEQARQAVERRAQLILAQLHEGEEERDRGVASASNNALIVDGARSGETPLGTSQQVMRAAG